MSVHSMNMAGPTMVEREVVGVSGQVNVDGLAEPEKFIEIYVPSRTPGSALPWPCGRPAIRWPWLPA